jgi:hypothetical protein
MLISPTEKIYLYTNMETQVHLPEYEPATTIIEVVAALKKQKLNAKYDKATWGDWINFPDKRTVISIDAIKGLTTRATIEEAEDEEDVLASCIAAFRSLGWQGEDEDGSYPL